MYELLSSMRFAIALLVLLALASVAGTVLPQHEATARYIDQFGPFWAQLFMVLQLHAVYSAWWFLLILVFLAVSTGLCVVRSTPLYLSEWRRFKEHVRVGSFRAMPHRAQATLPGTAQTLAAQMQQQLQALGWKVRLVHRPTARPAGWMLAAKAGGANRLGYIAAHAAIVLICVGGLLDSQLPMRVQMALEGKTTFEGEGLEAAKAPRHRMGVGTLAYRGNVMVAEGTRSNTAILTLADGVVLQDLPFSIELERFDVEYHANGTPRLFASEVRIHDRATGAVSQHRIAVNHPLKTHGVEIFQAGFDDGGSRVQVLARPLRPGMEATPWQGVIGSSAPISGIPGWDAAQVEWLALDTLNMENLAAAAAASASSTASGAAVDVRSVDLRRRLQAQWGAGHPAIQPQKLHDVGPSLSYRIRDRAGQAVEFRNYMRPIDLGDGLPVFTLGVRAPSDAQFTYWRIPQDEHGQLDGFLRLWQALHTPALRQQAIDRYVQQALPEAQAALREPLRQSATRALNLFAGAEAGTATAGVLALSQFLQNEVPPAEQDRAAQVLVRMLHGVLRELLQLARAQENLAPLPDDASTQTFTRLAFAALSDGFFYPEPVFFTLQDFEQVQASAFQVSQSPGRGVVYSGCVLLIVGIFAMLYVRERRLWVWLPEPSAHAAPALTHASMALSSNRQTLDTRREFEQLRQRLFSAAPPAPHVPPAP